MGCKVNREYPDSAIVSTLPFLCVLSVHPCFLLQLEDDAQNYPLVPGLLEVVVEQLLVHTIKRFS